MRVLRDRQDAADRDHNYRRINPVGYEVMRVAQKVQILGQDGMHIFPVYNDNRELVAEFESGELHLGDDVIYRGQVCEVLYEFTDTDGVKYMELLFKGGLGNVIDFNIL